MRKFCCMAVVLGIAAVMTAPASAETSAIIVAANVWASSEANAEFPEAGTKTQCVDSKHGVSYGEINWSERSNYAVDWCTAGYQWRLDNQSVTTPDYYERLAHWGYGYARDLYRQTRGIVRYDVDTFVTLGTARGRTQNLNGAQMPFLAQLEYRSDWYGDPNDPMTTDNQWSWFGGDQLNQVQLAQSPMGHAAIVYQWGPGPPAATATLMDWCFTGGGLTGKLQLAESTIITKLWSWGNDPNNPALPYYTFDVDPNFKLVDNVWGVRQGDYAWEIGDTDGVVANGGPGVPPYTLTDANATFLTDVAVGNRCEVFSGTGVVNVGAYNVDVVNSDTQLTLAGDAGSATGVTYRVTPWSAPSARGDMYLGDDGSGGSGTVLDLEVFYGASENVVYTCQYQGRIYKMTGVKDLGYRRMEGQPSHVGPGERVSGVTVPDYPGQPTYTPGTNLVGAGGEDNAQPLVGDKPSDYPSGYGSGPDPQGPYGVGITATEMFADKTGTRRYVGLAVDGGGRVYAVSQRVMENSAELASYAWSNTGNVWDVDPDVPSGFSLTDYNVAFDANSVGDVVLLQSGSYVNVGQYTIVSLFSVDKVELDADPGPGGMADAVYKLYEAGQNPKPSVTKSQGISYDVDRTVLLASDTDGVLVCPYVSGITANVANAGAGVPPYTLTDTSVDFVAAGLQAGDTCDVQGGTDVNTGVYGITVVATTMLTLDGDAGNSGVAGDVEYTAAGPFTLTSNNATFVAAGVTDSDRVAIINFSPAGNVGTYSIATGGVAATVLTLNSDPGAPYPGAGSPVSYEVFKPTQAVLEGDSNADVATTVLTDLAALFVTNANIDPLGGDKLAVISGTGANVGVYTIANGGVTETTLTITAGDMGNSGAAADVVYEVVDGKAGFVLIDLAADFVTDTVAYGDTVQLGWDGDPNLPNWSSGSRTVRGVRVNELDLSSDAGDSYSLLIDDAYNVYAPGLANWQSEALLDIFQADGTLDTTVDLNTLVRPDGNTMGGVMISGDGNVSGFMVGGDVEIAPNLVYEVAPADDVTRLWICGVVGDGNQATEDGLDLLLVDVTVDGVGAVASVSYLGGIDDPDLVGGEWYTGANYNIDGFEPFNMWLAYNDVEFDAAGNAVFVGGRGGNDNRHIGMAAADVLLAVGNMIQEAGLFEDAVVGTGARYLDMNYVGLGTDFGLAFDNSAGGSGGALPLRNYGAAPPPPPPVLVSSEPAALNPTLPKTQNNVILLVFDTALPTPLPNPALTVTMLSAPGGDYSNAFTYTIDADDLTGKTLKAKENLTALIGAAEVNNMKWFSVVPDPALAVEAFQLDVVTLIGDCVANKRVNTIDYTGVESHLGERNDSRYDVNGNGRINTIDYTVVQSHMGDRAPAHP